MTNDMPRHKNPDVIAKFVSLAAQLIAPDMTVSDYEKLRDIAGILNPSGNGFVKTLNSDVAKIAPFIKRR